MATFATDLGFVQEVRENLGEFSPFLTLLYQRYIDCIHFQASLYKANSHASFTSRVSLKPPATVKEKNTPATTWKVVKWGIFSMWMCPICISRFIFSFALMCIFNASPQAGSHLVHTGAGVTTSHFRRTQSVLFSLCYLLAHCSDPWCFLVVLFAHEMLGTFQLIGYE